MSKELIEQVKETLGVDGDSIGKKIVERIEELERELERERIRLAACGVVALANTPESAAKAREMLPEYRSASLDDVIRAVDSEMALQADNARLREALKKMNRAYVGLMENGRDRIIILGGDCDPVDVMEYSDQNLRESRAALAAAPEQSLARIRNQGATNEE